MFGISIYLSEDNDFEATIEKAAKNHFSLIFSSLHIPEENPANYKSLLMKLANAAKKNNMRLILDISAKSLENLDLDIQNADQLTTLGVTGLRVDYGLSTPEIAKLATKIKVFLNASTINRLFLEELLQAGVDITQVEAFHNYYPKPHTGLDTVFLKQTNKFLHEYGLKIAAFVPGDDALRQPLFEGLPTLEKHRTYHPFVAALELESLGIDHIYIGDPALRPETTKQFAAYAKDNTIALDCVITEALAPELTKQLTSADRNRMDPARDLIRLENSRPALSRFEIKPISKNTRPAGAITVDNVLFGRYQGEISIVRKNLPADSKTNNIGYLTEQARLLVPFIRPGQPIKLHPIVKESRY
ncbi:MupG family TIM beta-alpha barrel fold protein [Listeria booriae]|uniref:MupG family TIM beta-alpha barrel fold protein n=1 Tax=Listeria booriae TaxID=1552123 RepID=UPI001629EA04|nr:MupG family TIM beta-alpha barrel fold protein [Listeria booriae]MBC2257224.1 DUF871 domain-containing protein [Listeria booriae]